MVGSGYGDGVDILLLKDGTKVFVRHRGFAHFLFCRVGEFLKRITVDVAHVRNTGSVLVGFERGKVSIAATVQTNDSKVQAVVGTENLTVTFRGSTHSKASRANGNCIEKLTSREHVSSRQEHKES